jgi:hypothetical protein
MLKVSTAGTLTLGKADLTQYGGGQAVSIIDPQQYTIASGDISSNYVTINLTTPIQLGANEGLAFNPTSNNIKTSFATNTSGDGKCETNDAFKNGTPNVIGAKIKIWGY